MASLSVLNILRAIKERGTVSRTELQHTTGLSWGTITNTTRDLLNRNLIREQGAQSTKAGRKPVRLAINPESHSLIGVDLAGPVVRCLMLNLAGETLGYQEFRREAGDSPEEILGRAGAMIQQLLELPAVSSRLCLGVGVGAPGFVDTGRGVVRCAAAGWNDAPVRQYLQERVGAPVRIENDRNCLALAERWFGQVGQAEDVLCVNLGENLGLGILIHGEVFRGSQELAGDFGHMTVEPEGPTCSCGDRGCVEAYASVRAVREFARLTAAKDAAGSPDGLDSGQPAAAELIRAAHGGDEAARAAFVRMGKYLGIGIANLLDLFNPDLVILAGPLAEARELFLTTLTEEIQRHTSARANREMLISQLGERATAMGACGIVLQSVFESSALSTSELLGA